MRLLLIALWITVAVTYFDVRLYSQKDYLQLFCHSRTVNLELSVLFFFLSTREFVQRPPSSNQNNIKQ